MDITRAAAFLPAASLAGLLACLWFVPQRWARHALAGAGFFLLVLFPVLGLFNIYFNRYSFVSDHFVYLPLLGLCALAGALVGGLPPRARRLVAAALVTGLVAASQQRIPVFRDEATLWTDTLARNPGAWIALNNIGAARQAQGDLAGARWYYEEALRRNPGHYEALVNLGSVLLDQGEPTVAVQYYQRALQLKPDYPLALVNLGLALSRQGRVEEALGRFRQALAIQPDFIEAHVKAAGVLERAGRFDEAVAEWRAALQLRRVETAGVSGFFLQRAAEFERQKQPRAVEIYRRAAGGEWTLAPEQVI
jgi:tetratricopeptide (TPR) repeat protein